MMEFGLLSLDLHYFLRASSAGLFGALKPGCCWAYTAFSMQHNAVWHVLVECLPDLVKRWRRPWSWRIADDRVVFRT